MSLLPFFQWCEASRLGEAIRLSPWAFAALESVHLLGLAAIGGAVLLVDLRLLGLGLRGRPVAELAADAQPWLAGSLAVMVSTGLGLFMSESIKCYYNPAFWVKMTSLLLAIAFTFTVRRKTTQAAETAVRPLVRKLVAITSLLLWVGVGASGRWIGFSG